MIRIETDSQKLYAQITAKKANWLSRAKARTAQYAAAKKYTGGSEFWGEIKDVYIDLQHEKCAYCETKLAGKKYASKVHEIEHFRPKSRVSNWPKTGKKNTQTFVPPCPVGSASTTGYYLLPYHPFNYAIACTRCNSTLKSDYFPVRGSRNTKGSDPAKMSGEDHLLIYPISNLDEDPANLIHFDGVLAVPKKASGPKYERAVVTIEFFQLNHEDLTSRRAPIIAQLYNALETLRVAKLPAELKQNHLDAISTATSPASPFSQCANAFVELFKSDRAKATEYGKLAAQLARL